MLAVFLAHYADRPWQGVWRHSPLWFGWTGVDLFFVLSGFLITGILFDSLESPQYFRSFYIRRTLRIFPLFYAVWAVCLLLTPFAAVGWNRYVVAQMFYVGNLTELGAILERHADPGILMVGKYPLVFGHFWTLCIEEQFYLLWPLIVYTVRNRQVLLRVALVGSVLILIVRCVLVAMRIGGMTGFLYVASFSRFDSLLIGAVVALWLRGRPQGYIPSPKLYGWLLVAPAVILGCLLATVGRRQVLETSNFVIESVGFTLLALSASGALLAALDHRTRIHRWLQNRWLVSLGAVSYGFYVLHAIPLRLLDQVHLLGTGASMWARILVPPTALAFFYLLARCSYRWLESPFLKLKDKLAPPPKQVDLSL